MSYVDVYHGVLFFDDDDDDDESFCFLLIPRHLRRSWAGGVCPRTSRRLEV